MTASQDTVPIPEEPVPDATGAFAPDEAHRLVAECVERMAVEGPAAIEAICRAHPDQESTIRKRLQILVDAGLLESNPEHEQGIPDRLGEFRLLRRLGAGGMGVVYLAHQESLGREVALKLIRPEHLYFPGARERFQREIDVVARLQHPGIVPVYTVGEEAGIPYLAMQRVDGFSLEDLLATVREKRPEQISGEDIARALIGEAGRSVEQRTAFEVGWVEFCLRLVKQVADALHHAHRRGVLHRDIKPSNIMVTPSGRALLLDFGLASTRGTTRITRTNAQLGSVPYLSPEQARGEHDRVDERSDVYALGVTLYELLTLRLPFIARDAETTRARILQGDPIPIRKLNSRASWDVETVCLTAMERDPARRYGSADALSQDLENVLTLRPIQARRPGAWLRWGRLVKRHPALTVGSVLGFLLLVPVPTLLYLQKSTAAAALERSAQLARSERDRANEERTRAESQAQEALRQRSAADRVITFLVDLFGAPAPNSALGQELTAKDVLDRGARSIAAGFESDPVVRARLIEAIGQAYRALGRFPEAEPFLVQALDLRRRELGESDPATLDSRTALGSLYRSMGRWPAAEELLGRALADYRQVCGSDDRRTLRCLTEMAGLLHEMGRLDEATVLAEETLARRERVLGPDHEDTVASLITISRLRLARGDDAEAENLLTRALATCRRHLPSDHPHTQVVTGDLGTIYCARSDFARAEPLYQDCFDRSQRVHGEQHPDTLAAQSNLASVHYSLKHYPEAEALYRRALDAYVKIAPADHVDLLATLSGLGLVCLELGKTDEAQQLLERARDGFKKLAPDHSWTLLVKRNLAMVYRRQHRLSEAEALLQEVIEDTTRTLGENHPDLRGALNNLASVHEQQGRYEDAEALYLDAWERAIDDLGRDNPETVTFLKNLMLCYVKDGRFEEAEPLARELVERVPVTSSEHRAAQQTLDHILRRLGK